MNGTNINKVLIVAPNWLGDAVLALPAIAGIRELLPSSHMTVLGLPHICELFKESPYIDERTIYSGTMLTTVNELRNKRFDLAVLFPNSFRTALMVHLARIPHRCGYKRDGRGIMLNLPVSVTEETRKLDQVGYYLNIVSLLKGFLEKEILKQVQNDRNAVISDETPMSLGSQRKMRSTLVPTFSKEENSYPPLEKGGKGGFYPGFSGNHKKKEWLHLSKVELQNADKILLNYKVPSGSLIIGINPGAAYGSAKRWYPERFARVCRGIAERYNNANIIIFGSQQESGIAAEIEALSGVPVINMAGKTTIRGLISLIKQCTVFVTNDSGPMHIAAALAIPVVAIFGSTDPVKTGPMGDGNIVIRKNAECSPCFKRICPTDLKCMDLIKVEDVMAAVKSILG
ncbi:MAG: lipopolysaccharide heptosyltransferase II [Nitrospirae bacterium]|nr:lipopolysaccharide heptosyltransferase II [Nitrospirota bacterium]